MMKVALSFVLYLTVYLLQTSQQKSLLHLLPPPLQEALVEMMLHLTKASLSTMATVLSLPMVFLIMMLKMMQFLLIQTQDVKGELQIKDL